MKIHIYGGHLNFLQPIVDKLGITHDITICNDYVKPTFPDVDVVWFEWAENNVANFTKENEDYLKNKKVIVRLHAVEAYMGWYRYINWEVVDNLIVVAEHIKEKIIADIPDSVKVSVIPNGIDLDKWTYKCRSDGKNIAIVGHFQEEKGALFLPHIMSLLSSHHFHVVGQVRIANHSRTGEYFHHAMKPFMDRITFHSHQADLDKWYEECSINYILCPSISESFHVSTGEAMAKGIKPIINNFWGSHKIWMSDTIYSTIDKIPRILTGTYSSELYRKWIVDRYDLNKITNKINEIIKQ